MLLLETSLIRTYEKSIHWTMLYIIDNFYTCDNLWQWQVHIIVDINQN